MSAEDELIGNFGQHPIRGTFDINVLTQEKIRAHVGRPVAAFQLELKPPGIRKIDFVPAIGNAGAFY